MTGLLGKKIGMTSIFDDSGQVIPCTVIEAGPCFVTQIKTKERDGYEAVQLGFDPSASGSSRSRAKGHFAKANVKPTHLRPRIPRQRRRPRFSPDRKSRWNGVRQGGRGLRDRDVQGDGVPGRREAPSFRRRLPDARPERQRARTGLHRFLLPSLARLQGHAHGGTAWAASRITVQNLKVVGDHRRLEPPAAQRVRSPARSTATSRFTNAKRQ